MPIMLTHAAFPEFVTKQLQGYMIRAIEDSAGKISASEPATNLADYADRVDAFVQTVDWSDDRVLAAASMVLRPSDDKEKEFTSLRHRIGMHAAAGRLMLAAALGSKDGSRVKKAIAYFVRASAIFDSWGEVHYIQSQKRFLLT
jgi:hypothetical protein